MGTTFNEILYNVDLNDLKHLSTGSKDRYVIPKKYEPSSLNEDYMDNKRKIKLTNNNSLVYEINPVKEGYRSWLVIMQIFFQDYRLLQSIRYAYTGDSIMVTAGADKEQCVGIHENMIRPVLAELATSLNGSGEAERMAKETGYSNVRYYLDMPGTDSLQGGNTPITVDILSFNNLDFNRCLNAIGKKEYYTLKWTPESLEQCLVFAEEGKLVVVWCSLFHDGKEAAQKVREIWEPLTVDSPKYKKQTEGH